MSKGEKPERSAVPHLVGSIASTHLGGKLHDSDILLIRRRPNLCIPEEKLWALPQFPAQTGKFDWMIGGFVSIIPVTLTLTAELRVTG